jgi:sugar lactone lactonase YvrE
MRSTFAALLPRRVGALCLALAFIALAPASAQAAPPQIKATSFKAIGETTATLEATLNPTNVKTPVYHFQYVDQATFEKSGFSEAKSTPDGAALPAKNEDIPFSAEVSGLSPGTAYRFRVFAENTLHQKVEGPALLFATLSAPQLFGPCPNEEFRSGNLAPLGEPSSSLPDCRAYEQASPLDKDGGDVIGFPQLVKAASDGSGITFGSTFGIPGGKGAQDLPLYLASRGEGEEGWSTQGLLPPASTGERNRSMVGWLPDFSASFGVAVKLATPREQALFELHRDGSPPTQMTPYTGMDTESDFAYAGASKDASEVVFEVPAKLPPKEGDGLIPEAKEGHPNVYAWDSESGRVNLASVMNTQAESEEALPKGAFAGPYWWVRDNPNSGGAKVDHYLQEERAVSSDGSAFFTAVGSGQLYRRLNPTEPQSALDSNGNCTEPAKACTIHISESRTPPDPQGSQPAAFQAASADGSKAFFTSSEELTADANTGPVQPQAQIGRAKPEGSEAKEVKEDFLPTHALGIAVAPDGKHIYWANPTSGTIGRAELNGSTVTNEEPRFIEPGETEAETHPESEPGVFHSAPSTPRYVAVDANHVYWTNTGPLGEEDVTTLPEPGPVEGGGTIGRATLVGPEEEPQDPRPEFIKGASNPQGIAVNESHIYWANAARDAVKRSIGRAEIEGGGVEQKFGSTSENLVPNGVALSPTHVYYSEEEVQNNFDIIARIPLEGGEAERFFVGKAGIRGIALDGSHVYWATQGEAAIGRNSLSSFDKNCGVGNVDCQNEFIKPAGTPFGVASDGEHLFWSVNGEAPPNPGNDLYRYEVGKGLSDLTPDSTDANGAEVKGVLGASADGSHVYFVANADLDGVGGPASAGNCEREFNLMTGACNLYLWHEGAGTEFIARLKNNVDVADNLDWVPSPFEVLSSGSYFEKTSQLTPDGETLLFRSQERLGEYENAGKSEYYLFGQGSPGLACVTCNPTGQAPTSLPTIGTTNFPNLGPSNRATEAVVPRLLSTSGNRVFFETTEALVSADTNGIGGCPTVGAEAQAFKACQDVYEWEAPGAGSCKAGAPPYSPLNEGCIYLISTGKSPDPSFFADASESGNDVFFFTRDQLVGQDTDGLQDVYDARVDGGLVSQASPPLTGCEGEGCKGGASTPPSTQSPVTGSFGAPGNVKGRAPAGCRKPKRKVKGRCVKPKKHRARSRKRTGSKRP